MSTTTSVGSSLNPSTSGQSVTFTATVSDTSGGVPTGSVEFYDGSTDLGPGSALSGSGNSATSTLTTSTLTAGSHSISAVYTPTGDFAGSSGSLTQTVNPPATATFNGKDTTTEGSWIGVYGSQGYNVINATNGVNYPSYATVTPAGNKSYTWAASTNVPQALQNPPSGTSRIAAGWYSSTSFTVDVDLTDGQSHNIELYLLDYDTTSRSEQIVLTDANTHAVLSTQTVSSFHDGVYMSWTISGNVLITITKTGGTNAVLSGLFFDPTTSPTPTATATALIASTAAAGLGPVGHVHRDGQRLVCGRGNAERGDGHLQRPERNDRQRDAGRRRGDVHNREPGGGHVHRHGLLRRHRGLRPQHHGHDRDRRRQRHRRLQRRQRTRDRRRAGRPLRRRRRLRGRPVHRRLRTTT